jgi:hypothetical protein
VTAPGDPYGEPFRVRPRAGLLVVFPSWLYHWVHPYSGQGPRIAISFNATVAPVAELKAPTRDCGATVEAINGQGLRTHQFTGPDKERP